MQNALKEGAEKALAKRTGKAISIKGSKSVGGGCINNAQRLETTAGTFFIKSNDASRYPGMFEAEARGLAILKSAGAIRVPDVVACGEAGAQSFIILEFIDSAGRSKTFWEKFGQALANLHRHSSRQFGLDHDNYIGSLRQFNRWHDNWDSFFIEERLQKQAQLALEHGLLSKKHINQFESLYKKLEGLFPDEPPALLHGDLWSGNFITADDGYACIIDPAIFYGHREMELSFTQLFGGFDARFYDAYHESFPLQAGFENRKDLCNLYPLLVHVNLFGGGYAASVENILNRFA
jgi:fructosamine-3-kinase